MPEEYNMHVIGTTLESVSIFDVVYDNTNLIIASFACIILDIMCHCNFLTFLLTKYLFNLNY